MPYWRKGTGIRVTSPAHPVVASGWKRGDGNLLVMVLSDSDAAALCELTIDFAQFGFTSAAVKCLDYGGGGLACPESFKDIASKSQVAEKEGPIRLQLGRHSYRILRFCR